MTACDCAFDANEVLSYDVLIIHGTQKWPNRFQIRSEVSRN